MLHQKLIHRVRLPLLIGAFGLIVSTSTAAQTPTSAGKKSFIDVDGVSIAYRVSVDGKPFVVFENGLGESLETWDSVYPEVSKFDAALVYSRPGLGESGPSPLEQDGVRTSEESARFLKRLLEKIGAPPPYIMVGHSLGGLNALKFVELYPEAVGAVVLVDARPRNFRGLCEEQGANFCRKPRAAPPDWPLAVKAEIVGTSESEETAPTAEMLGSIPITVIASTQLWPGEDGPKGYEVWLAAQKRLAASVENGRFVLAERSGHYIQKDRPDIVIDEIREIEDRMASPPH